MQGWLQPHILRLDDVQLQLFLAALCCQLRPVQAQTLQYSTCKKTTNGPLVRMCHCNEYLNHALICTTMQLATRMHRVLAPSQCNCRAYQPLEPRMSLSTQMWAAPDSNRYGMLTWLDTLAMLVNIASASLSQDDIVPKVCNLHLLEIKHLIPTSL